MGRRRLAQSFEEFSDLFFVRLSFLSRRRRGSLSSRRWSFVFGGVACSLRQKSHQRGCADEKKEQKTVDMNGEHGSWKKLQGYLEMRIESYQIVAM
jgi:hypothetical protein